MQTVLLKPRNLEELNFVSEFIKKNKMKATFIDDAKSKKKKEFLINLEKSVEEVQKHLRGEIQLKSAEDLLNEL